MKVSLPKLAAVIVAGVVTSALTCVGPASATTVRPAWNQASCPAWEWQPNDRLCYFAYDNTTNPAAGSWVAAHFYTGSDGHDYAWANGYARNVTGSLFINDNATWWTQLGQQDGTGYLQIAGPGTGFYDGPGHNIGAALDIPGEGLYTNRN